MALGDITSAHITPKAVHLKDYAPPDFFVDSVELYFELGEAATTVRAKLVLRANPLRANAPMNLDGRHLALRSVVMDGRKLEPDAYTMDDESLTIHRVPASFVLETEVEIKPHENTALEGLYKSGSMFCTQCEAQGFRRITYFPDRPDVLACYTTTIEADQARYPTLLSNGNRVAVGVAENGRHWAKWHDPFPKPSYLYALVAGDLSRFPDRFVTASGRSVNLDIFAEHSNSDKCEHAMRCLKQAMRWDEDTFGREYDLDTYMIVAVDDFNMGAMENKGLNIFNSQCVLAKPQTATDGDFESILGVIGHEYFHNWTGNRVTCRDWFQLSLKEGLTVFRDQMFTADMTSAATKRIGDVVGLRASQFPEDAGPMAHSVRPDSYIEISNFYTATVYLKGAEVIRMMHTLLGEKGFRKGMDLYFERHDGQAVTCEDFVAAMQDANGLDLGQFKLWYSQSGTPEITVQTAYDAQAKVYTLTLTQSCAPTPGQPTKQPLHIPLAVGLVGRDGSDLPLQLEGEVAPAGETTRVLSLRKETETLRFVNAAYEPVPSLLRGFSAPVKLRLEQSEHDLLFLLRHDNDPFNRWEAGHRLAVNILLRTVEQHRAGTALTPNPRFIEALADALANTGDKRFAAQVMTLPSETY
ncbi:MAG: aminopeptidase N, partial [Methyloceanibacter sp.]